MSKVVYHTVPIEKAENVDFGEWLLKRWPVGSVRPRGLLIFKNDENITHTWVNDPSVLNDPDATYHLYELPRGGIVSAITGVIGAILNPILKIFTPQGNVSNATINSKIKSSNNSLQGRSNDSRPGERIADIRGMVRAYPDLLMNYNIFKDGTEFECQFLCLGAGSYVTDEISDGVTPITNVSGSQISIYEPGTAPGYGSPSTVINGAIDIASFPVVIAKESNEVDGAELFPPNYADVSSGNVTYTIYSTGQIDAVSNDDDNPINWSDRVAIGDDFVISGFISLEEQIVGGVPTGLYYMHDLSGTYQVTGTSDDGVLLDVSGNANWSFLSSTGQAPYTTVYDVGGGLYSLTASSGGTKITYKPSMDTTRPYSVGPYLMINSPKILVNAYAQNGIYRRRYYITPFDVTLRVTVSNYDNPSDPEYTFDFVVKGSTSATGASLLFDNPYPDAAFIRMQRITDTTLNESISTIDTVKWRDMYGITDISPRSYGNVTTIHSVTKATSAALKLKERKLNMLATRIYNGIPSSNFADVVMSMHLDPHFGRRDLSTIDVDALYAVQQQLLDYFGDPRAIQVGYTFDDNGTTYEEALQTICNTVNVTPYQVGSVLYFWPELPQSVSAMQFGHAFKVPDTDKRTRAFAPPKEYTGVQVKYFDHDEKSYLYVTIGEETNLNKIDLVACQSKYLATIRANREMNKLRYQRITHECTALSIGLQATPGMRVDMIDNTRMKQHEGVIVDVDGLTLTLSDPVDFVTGNTYSITITGRLGALENIPVSPGDDEFTVVLQSAPTEEIYTGWLQDRTSYIIRTDDERSKLAMLVQTMEPSGADNNYQVGLTCINYDARYYQDDIPF